MWAEALAGSVQIRPANVLAVGGDSNSDRMNISMLCCDNNKI